MKHLMRYEGYSTTERTDDILDKISKYGIDSITKLEKEFLDAYSSGKDDEVLRIHNKIAKEENEIVFEDESGRFKFELDSIEEFEHETHYIGTLYVPDLNLTHNKSIEGILEGMIVAYKNGDVSPNFYHNVDNITYYDIFEFCDGLEYELDKFLDYVISELKSKNNI